MIAFVKISAGHINIRSEDETFVIIVGIVRQCHQVGSIGAI